MPGTRGGCRVGVVQFVDERLQRALGVGPLLLDLPRPPPPGAEHGEGDEADREREPAAVRGLGQVRAEEGEVDGEEDGRADPDQPPRFFPERLGDDEEEQGVGGDRAGDRDAVGRAERGRGAEADHQRDDRDQQEPVDRRQVDLADLFVGGVADLQPRQEAELDRLLGHREGARDHRLRGDHRRHRRQHHHRHPAPVRDQQEEGVGDRARVADDQRALAQVVERQRREDDEEPGAADRRPAEVAHVGVERLGAGDRQHDRAER